jgi:rifampicin phosphotransferase
MDRSDSEDSSLSMKVDIRTIIRELTELEATTVPVVGGKFASLARLFQARVIIPPAICLTTEASSIMINEIGCDALVIDLINSQRNGDYNRSVEISQEISSRIRTTPMPSVIRDGLDSKLSNLAYPLIVRSSASQEDSTTRSFAGIFESVLGVNSLEETLDSIKECWASLFSEKVIAYCKSDMSVFENCKMAVICQEMLTPSVGGVAFTCDPLKGESIFTINANWGLPSLLVSGEIVPDLYELGMDGVILQRQIGSKRQISEYINGELKTRPATTIERRHYCLSDQQLNEIYQCGKRIESIFRCPQDIEWAIQADHLYVLQSRAITTMPGNQNGYV